MRFFFLILNRLDNFLWLDFHKHNFQDGLIFWKIMAIKMKFCFESVYKILESDESSSKFIINFDACGFAIPREYLNW